MNDAMANRYGLPDQAPSQLIQRDNAQPKAAGALA